jgi:integrase
MNSEINIVGILPSIRVPTLVLHRTEDPTVGIEGGRFLAKHIPGAKLVELDGTDHLPWLGNNAAQIADMILDFIAEPRDRALSPDEIRKFLTALERVACAPTLRMALRFVLLTGVRKSEFIDATWPEIDFDKGFWTIPAARMKAGKAHVVPLSEQAQDILVAFRSCFAASEYLHPGRYDHDVPISNATLNRVIDAAVKIVQKDDPEFQSFGVHDLRRTFSTGLNRSKWDERWIEMSLAHAPKNRIAAIYNVNRYLSERRIMLQCWADMIDCWTRGGSAREVIADAKRRAADIHEDDLDDDL